MHDFETSKPIFQQIIDRILFDIEVGDLAPGAKVLSVREMALEYQVNPNTIQRSLLELEKMGYLHTQRAVGRTVTTDLDLIASLKGMRSTLITEKYIKDMRNIGVDGEEILRHVGKILQIPENVCTKLNIKQPSREED